MASFSKKKSREAPAVSTASLPDIVFMLLFFFMVSTTMKQEEPQVEIKLPEATEIEKLEDKDLVITICIGPPVEKEKFGTEPRIQLNDAFGSPGEIIPYIELKKQDINEARWSKIVTNLKVDRNTETGIVTDVKQQLRKAQARRISYASLTKKEDN